MTLHLIKMCVGISDLDMLKSWRAERRKTQPRCLVHTRNTPKRGEEILDGGSLYWVIKGQVQARQRVIGIESTIDEEGRPHCLIELEHEIVPTLLQPCRAFQGWRYLEPQKAPADRRAGDDMLYEMPPEMARELRELGLI